jgi:hypothetical protein
VVSRWACSPPGSAKNAQKLIDDKNLMSVWTGPTFQSCRHLPSLSHMALTHNIRPHAGSSGLTTHHVPAMVSHVVWLCMVQTASGQALLASRPGPQLVEQSGL